MGEIYRSTEHSLEKWFERDVLSDHGLDGGATLRRIINK